MILFVFTCGVKLLEYRYVHKFESSKKLKAEPSRLIPRKIIENLELLFVVHDMCLKHEVVANLLQALLKAVINNPDVSIFAE